MTKLLNKHSVNNMILIAASIIWIVTWGIMFIFTKLTDKLAILYDGGSSLGYELGMILAVVLFYIPFLMGGVTLAFAIANRAIGVDSKKVRLTAILGAIFISAFLCGLIRILFFIAHN